MVTVNELVRVSILTYPRLYSNAWEVGHHILCVIGNGYAWTEDGTIEREERVPPSRPWTPAREWEGYGYLFGGRDVIDDIMRPRVESNIVKFQHIVDTVDERVNDYARPDNPEFYPQTEYARLMNVPANVTADWAELVAFFTKEAKDHGWKF